MEHLSPTLERRASIEDYWKSSEGLTRRIQSLSQVFNWKLINNACKVIAPVNRAKWLERVDYGDANVCPICLHNSVKGGRKGFYRVTWFMPEMPPHPGCRCQWVIWFIDPVKQIKLGIVQSAEEMPPLWAGSPHQGGPQAVR